ncbi:MAG: hypothetical protein H7843_12020 [Nitrospirota bacterium]
MVKRLEYKIKHGLLYQMTFLILTFIIVAPLYGAETGQSFFNSVMEASDNPLLNTSIISAHAFNKKEISAEQCGVCHTEQYRDWQRSNHSVAAAAPVYNWFELKVNLLTGGATRIGGDLPYLCIRCHSPAATFDHFLRNNNRTVIAQMIEPEKDKNILIELDVISDELMHLADEVKPPYYPTHKLGKEGVTCLACHAPVKDNHKDYDLLRKINHHHGINTMFYDMSGITVRTGRHAAGGLDSRKLPSSTMHRYGFHHIITEDEIQGTATLDAEQKLDFADGFSGGGKGKGNTAGVCRHCHMVQTRLHVNIEDDPLEQMTVREWQHSAAFKDGQSCVDCHMVNTYKGKAELGDMSKYTQEKRFKNIPVANHMLVGGANALMSAAKADELGYPLEYLAVEKIRMLRSTLDFQVLLKPEYNASACVPGKATVGIQLNNTRGGHNVPTGVSQFRELWVEAEIKCGGKVIFSSGKVSSPYEVLGGHEIGFKRYSEIKKLTPGARDFYFPVIMKNGLDTNLIYFTDSLYYTKSNIGGKPVLDFAGSVYFTKFTDGLANDISETGPVITSKLIYYPELDIKQCDGQPAAGHFALNWRFYPPWLLMDIKKNIEAGRSGDPAGFPPEALADIDSNLIDAIDDNFIKSNKTYTLFEINDFPITANICKDNK